MEKVAAVTCMGVCLTCVALVLSEAFKDNLLQRVGLSVLGLCSFMASAAFYRGLPVYDQLMGMGAGAAIIAVGALIKLVPHGDEHKAHQ